MIVYLKSKEEISGFREAGKIAGKVLSSILNEIKPEVTTSFLNEVAIEECKKHNVVPTFLGYSGFPAAICASVNNILVHGIPNENKLKPEDIVSIDVGISMDGFIGDTAETVWVEEPKYEVYCLDSYLIECCRKSLDLGIEAAKSGNKLNDISKAIFDMIKMFGLSTPIEYGGHGIDRYKLHAHPFVSNNINKNEMLLRPGMIIAIEPMVINGSRETKILEDQWSVMVNGLSAHCEHTILITEEGPEVLTRR
jgi:methionyl aminopeptidase